MAMITTILIIIAFLIAIPLIVAAFLKKEFLVSREIIVDRTRKEVFNFVRSLRNQNDYSKWVMTDPNMKKEYRGTDGTTGFVMAWDSDNKNVGKGEQEIKNIVDGKRIDYELRFIKPFAMNAEAYMITEAIENDKTKVIWAFKSRNKYPMNLMPIIMNMDKVLGNDLMIGLSNLKNILERQEAK